MYDREKNSIACKKYYQGHKPQIKERQLKDRQRIYKWRINYCRNLRERVSKKLGNECSNPYRLNHGDFLDDARCLQIDHINGGGNKDVKRLGGGQMKYYPYLLGLPEQELKSNYQLLCANCNWIKRFERNENRQRVFIN